jgi:hypothetical protein
MGQDVVNYATINFDALVVGACGNTNSELTFYPASYENVLSVAATTQLDEKWAPENTPTTQGSSYSSLVDVSAPGAMFSTTTLDSYIQVWGGTSFAAPIVSGCAGILRSYFPDYSAMQISELLRISTDVIDTIPFNIPYAGQLGTGRINLFKALSMEQTPSIAFENYEVNINENIVTINGDFVNYLRDAVNLNIELQCNSEFVSIPNILISVGALNTLQTYVSNGEIILVLADNVPVDYKIVLKFSFTDDAYSGYQNIEFFVNPGFKDIFTNKLQLSVAGNGRQGYTDVNSSIGNGLIYGNYLNLLYDCGIISGTSASNLYCAIRQSTDFKTLIYPTEILNAGIGDYRFQTVINDSNDIAPIGVKIIQDAYSWSDVDSENFIILDYQLINTGMTDITSYYFGLFTDWDLVDAALNSSHYNSDNTFMYCQNDGSQNMYAGIKLLTEQNSNNYSLAQVTDGDGIIDITNGFLDVEKFHMISNSNVGNTEVSTDIVQYTGAGPFDIPAGDTIVVGFAMIAAESIFTLNQAVEFSSDVYNNIIHPSSIDLVKTNGISVYPNPAKDIIVVDLSNKYQSNCTIELLNAYGSIVMTIDAQEETTISLKDENPGVYYLRVIGTDENYTCKIIKLD